MGDAARLARYGTAATALALLSDRQFGALVDQAPVVASGIGGTAVALDLDGVPVFAKQVPLTDLERRPENQRCTANLFGLPTFTHYGIGSAGGGAWRELAAHVMTTHWVLQGRCENFPLLYHWRVLDGPTPAAPSAEQRAETDQQVAYWAGSPAVRRRLEALASASARVVLCCERLPWTLSDWLTEQVRLDGAATACTLVERQLRAGVAFLNTQGLLHFDAHFGNVLTDGHRLYLTDFGLATSTRFDLSAAEHAFVREHADHDDCYMLTNLVNWLVTALAGTTDRAGRVAFVRRCAEDPAFLGAAGLPPVAAAIIGRYAPIAVVMNDFYGQLVDHSRTTPYPAAELQRVSAAVAGPVAPRR